MRLACACVLCGLLLGCADDAETTSTTGVGGASGCEPGELAVGDACQPAGIPPEACGAGFATDNHGGCQVTLPACPSGEMAVPGETTCRPVAPCGRNKWGEAPIEATTEFVDAAYAGGASDGSQTAPWTSVQQAIDGAAAGAVIAIADGSYVDDIVIAGKPVRLWGRCPSEVEIVGTGPSIAAVFVQTGAGGTEIHDVALRGALSAFALSGAVDVVLDRVWVHDTGNFGIDAENDFGVTSLRVSRSLFERTTEYGIFVEGADAVVQSTVVRDTAPSLRGFGRGINVQASTIDGARGSLSVVSSLVERNRQLGVYGSVSDVVIETTVVRDTEGHAIALEDENPMRRAIGTVRTSILDNNVHLGIMSGGSDLTMEATVVRGTRPGTDGLGGRALNLQAGPTPGRLSTAFIKSSLLELNHELGVQISGSTATLEGVWIRDTQPQASDQKVGRGINVQSSFALNEPSQATITGSVIERGFEGGVVVVTSSATIHGSLIVGVQAGVADGLLGDGIAVLAERGPASAIVTGSRSAENARAGLAAFGAHVELGDTALGCNPIDLDGELFGGTNFELVDLGGNVCGCGEAVACKVVSSQLQPPSAAQ